MQPNCQHRFPAAFLPLAIMGYLFAAPAHAAPEGVTTGGCEVLASGQLRSNEYIAHYEGGCKNGLAQGEGKATWRSRYSEAAKPIEWQGRFTQGIFLAERQALGAKRVDSTRVLLDMGPLDAPKGAKTKGRMWVESRVDGKLPASACMQPVSVQVSANGTLSDETLAKGWLNNAWARWLAICSQGAADALKGRNLRVQLHDGTGWTPDSNGNIPGSAVQAVRPFTLSASAKPEDAWQQYSNRAAREQASATRDKQVADEMQANKARILAFAKKTGASRFVELAALEKNPFRFGDEVILVAVRIAAARTPVEAVVRSARSDRYDWSRVLLRGPIAQWDEQGRVVAVRVKGRSTEDQTRDAVILEMVEAQRCEESNCADYLLMPGRRWLSDDALNAGVVPPALKLADGR